MGMRHKVRPGFEVINFEAGVLLGEEELANLGLADAWRVPAYYILERCLVHYSIYRTMPSLYPLHLSMKFTSSPNALLNKYVSFDGWLYWFLIDFDVFEGNQRAYCCIACSGSGLVPNQAIAIFSFTMNRFIWLFSMKRANVSKTW